MNFSNLILNRFIQLSDQRKSLINQLELAIEQQQQTSTNCKHQSDGDYIQQLIQLSTTAFLEIKDEVKLLIHMLESDLARNELSSLMKNIETIEALKISECLQQILMRRKAHLEQRDYTQQITTHQEKIDSFSHSILDLTDELRAELVQLPEN